MRSYLSLIMEKESFCAVCKKKASISPSYTKASYCAKHFRELIEKRVRKDLRILKAINIKIPYYFEEDGSPLSTLTKGLLKSIFEDRLQYTDNHDLPLEQHIFPLCLEQCVADQFQDFLGQGDLGVQGVYPLRSVSLEDVQLLLPEEDFSMLKTDEFFKDLEKKQSGASFAMTNVFDVLRMREKQK